MRVVAPDFFDFVSSMLTERSEVTRERGELVFIAVILNDCGPTSYRELLTR